MDMNEYALKKLALLERIAEGLETLNEKGIHVMNFHLPEGTALQAIGNLVTAGPAGADGKITKAADVKDGDTTQVIDRKVVDEVKAEVNAEQANKAAAEAAAKDKADKEAAEAAAAAKKAKAPTQDDVRNALKKFAGKEGNDAAMELLKSFGAASVTTLMEKGDDVAAKMIAKVEAALKD